MKSKKIILVYLVLLLLFVQNTIFAQYNVGNADGFAFARVGSSGSEVPLPIELLYFTAAYTGNNTEVKWKTASEINNNYFTIERSTDGVNFEVIAIVSSLAPNGNSTSELLYTYVDLNYTPGTYYYRLKQTDFDGKYKYSNIKAVEIKDYIGFTFEVAPNPNNGKKIILMVTAKKNEIVNVSITDMLGQILVTIQYKIDYDGSDSFPLIIPEKLTSGIYIFTATCEGNHQTVNKRVVIE